MWSPSARPGKRRLWIAVGVLAILAVLGTIGALVFRDPADGGASPPTSGTLTSQGPAAPSASRSAAPPQTGARTRMLPGSAPEDSTLVGGFTNHLDFARAVAESLLAYDLATDFQARNSDLLRAALPDPLGDAASLARDLEQYTPTGAALESIRQQGTAVTVELDDVSVSQWAAKKLAAIGARSGTYGVDITGTQTITTKAGGPIAVPVQMGVTVAGPPAAEFCGLDRVYPRHLRDALGSG